MVLPLLGAAASAALPFISKSFTETEPIQKTQNQQQSGTTTFTPSKQQQQLLNLAMPTFKQYAQNPVQAYGGQQVAGFDPLQTQGQEMVLGAVPGQQATADVASGGHQFLASGDVLRPDSNPALQQHMDAAVQPLFQNLMETVLPTVRGSAYSTGGFGGSRQGIAEGLGIDRTQQAAGATTANIANQGYQAGLDAMTKGLALTPTVQEAQAQPGLTTSSVGDVRQAQEQAELDRKVQDYYFNQFSPFLTAKEIAAISSGIPGGSTTTSGTASGVSEFNPPDANPLMTAVGGAMQFLPFI